MRQNYKKAAELYIKACDAGNSEGCFFLGMLYKNGEGVMQDKNIAKELFGKVCDNGVNEGCELYKTLQ